MTRLKVHEGDWFAVPLVGGGYGTGVVSRRDSSGALVGYFFGPVLLDLPHESLLHALAPERADLIGRFGPLGLEGGDWPILGQLDGWNRTEWPTPAFARYEELTGRTLRVLYDEDDLNRIVSEAVVDSAFSIGAPQDGLMGSGFVEQRLTLLLRPDR